MDFVLELAGLAARGVVSAMEQTRGEAKEPQHQAHESLRNPSPSFVRLCSADRLEVSRQIQARFGADVFEVLHHKFPLHKLAALRVDFEVFWVDMPERGQI
ncbi:hypothetical protein Ae201684P_003113 [Aphanomyces euteiches]|nr:hypothetical protein Ae201684P_003113 [Aphanomyces euteiches]